MDDLELSLHPLFEQILAAPGRDEARLVLADELVQGGDPRGELIVAQCELARLLGAPPFPESPWARYRLDPSLVSTHEKRVRKLTRLQNKLLRANPGWAPPVDPDRVRLSFWRGFISELRIRSMAPWRWTADTLGELMDRLPLLSRLYFFNHSADQLDDLRSVLLEHPAAARLELLFIGLCADGFLDDLPLSGLRHLTLHNHQDDDPPRGLARLARNPCLARLEGVESQSSMVLAADEVVALVQSPVFALKELRIPNATLGDDGLARVAASPGFAAMRILDLSASGVGPAGLAAALDTPHPPELERFALAHGKLRAVDASRLAESPILSSLTMLDLDSNSIGPEGLGALARSACLPSLRSLSLRNCRLKDGGIERLAASPLLAHIEELNIRSNQLTDQAAAALAGSENASSLCRLNINNNKGITPEGARLLWESEHLVGCRIFIKHKKPRG